MHSHPEDVFESELWTGITAVRQTPGWDPKDPSPVFVVLRRKLYVCLRSPNCR